MIPHHGHPIVQDEDCIALIRSGGAAGEAAKKALYLRYRNTVRSTIADILNRFPSFKSDADDLLHDAYIVLIRKIESDHPPAHSLGLYWIGISRRLLRNQVKRDQKMVLVEDGEALPIGLEVSPEDLYIESESRYSLLQCFHTLPERCQRLLMMWMDQYTVEEITARLELPNTAFTRTLKYKCFKKIKDLVRRGHKLPFSRHNRVE